MSSRHLENWLDGYSEYTFHTESPRSFHKWAGISAIAAALRKKVKFQLGRLSTFPNLYIVLVAEPGVSRKTTALDYCLDITREVDAIVHAADSTTREALIEELERSAQDHSMLDGTSLKHNSLSIISREFESFIGQKKDNAAMLTLLTDLFDCGAKPWQYKTKNKGTNTLNAVYVNLLAATTPESLAVSLPSSAVGGGLTSRILFILASGERVKYAIPPVPPQPLVRALIHDLDVISRLTGVYTFSKQALDNWIQWYEAYDGESIHRICKDRLFAGWYSRKSTFVQKLVQILTAARSNSFTIEWNVVEEAISLLEEVETTMANAFVAIGRSDLTIDVTNVCAIVDKYGKIFEKQLLHLVYRDMDAAKFDNVMATAVRCGAVIKDISNGNITYASTKTKTCQ